MPASYEVCRQSLEREHVKVFLLRSRIFSARTTRAFDYLRGPRASLYLVEFMTLFLGQVITSVFLMQSISLSEMLGFLLKS